MEVKGKELECGQWKLFQSVLVAMVGAKGQGMAPKCMCKKSWVGVLSYQANSTFHSERHVRFSQESPHYLLSSLMIIPSISLIKRGKNTLPPSASLQLFHLFGGFYCEPQECVSSNEFVFFINHFFVQIQDYNAMQYELYQLLSSKNLDKAIKERSQWTAMELCISVCQVCNVWNSSLLKILIYVSRNHLLS